MSKENLPTLHVAVIINNHSSQVAQSNLIPQNALWKRTYTFSICNRKTRRSNITTESLPFLISLNALDFFFSLKVILLIWTILPIHIPKPFSYLSNFTLFNFILKTHFFEKLKCKFFPFSKQKPLQFLLMVVTLKVEYSKFTGKHIQPRLFCVQVYMISKVSNRCTVIPYKKKFQR